MVWECWEGDGVLLGREAAELILRCAQNDKGRGKALVRTEGSGGFAR